MMNIVFILVVWGAALTRGNTALHLSLLYWWESIHKTFKVIALSSDLSTNGFSKKNFVYNLNDVNLLKRWLFNFLKKFSFNFLVIQYHIKSWLLYVYKFFFLCVFCVITFSMSKPNEWNNTVVLKWSFPTGDMLCTINPALVLLTYRTVSANIISLLFSCTL